MISARNLRVLLLWLLLAPVLPALAQQTGAISGTVADSSGLALPGVTVEAASDVLPSIRASVTDEVGRFRLPALPPGTYTLTFTLSGMSTVTRQALVQLGQDTVVDAALGVAGVSETVQVTAAATLIDKEAATIKSGLSSEQITGLPVGQQYRDLVKLIPGVQYTQDQTRGPSAGGSGQDNVYYFDGVNVTLPLYGTLSAEPASHDVAQVTTVKGGARAVDFERSGGFSIDSVSKSGTNRFAGQLSYQFQTAGMAADLASGVLSRYEQDRTWLTVNGGGPVIPNKLLFYGSWYRPTKSRDNASNLYGDLPSYESTRNEGFAKLTATPVSTLLTNFSYRKSHRLDKGDTFGQATAATAGSGAESWQRIITADASWVVNAKSYVTFKYTNFENPTQGRPDNVADVAVNTAIGTRLDLASLDKIGRFTVPTLIAGNTAFNAFAQPLIDRYGYQQNGIMNGGGIVGYGQNFDEDNFFRNAGQVAYNLTLGSKVTHDLHVGYQMYRDAEELIRKTNGWGLIDATGARLSFNGVPIYYTARFSQQQGGSVPPVRGEYRSQNIEVNDSIRWKDFTFNIGLLASNDTLYGQGLKEDKSTLSGYVASRGTKYEMYDVPFSKMLQPRIGATWAYNGKDTLYGSYASYNPAGSSLPRAASWDRNLVQDINAYFDQNGVLFATTPEVGSSGKLFVPDMTPRTIKEVLVGTARQLNAAWSGRLYARYRSGSHFWEDTNNNARVLFNPPSDIPRDLYIADLSARTTQIGSGSSYVIAELDGAYTKYYEASLESEWRGKKAFVRGSYTWSRYYGNFDQDNSTAANDANVFIGSSFIGDGAGRQLWNFRNGTLRGDRPHMLKLYGYYSLPWNATTGAYAVAQSGQPWETWSYEPYVALTTNTSDSSRYAEKAGSRRSPSHYQLDLNYTQVVRVMPRVHGTIVVDLYNVFNKQTGYNYQPAVHTATYGQPRSYYDPRVIQLAFRLTF